MFTFRVLSFIPREWKCNDWCTQRFSGEVAPAAGFKARLSLDIGGELILRDIGIVLSDGVSLC